MEVQEMFTPAAIAGLIGGVIGALVNAMIGAVRGAWVLRRESKEQPYRQRLSIDLGACRIVEDPQGLILEAAVSVENIGNIALELVDANLEISPRIVTPESNRWSKDIVHDEPDVYDLTGSNDIPGLELLPGEHLPLYLGIELVGDITTPVKLAANISSTGSGLERQWRRERLVFGPRPVDNEGTP